MNGRRYALITGASRGIGAGIAKRLSAEGYSLLLHYNRSLAEATALAGRLPGSDHRFVRADLSTPEGVDILAGQIDVPLAALVNNAGVYLPSPCDGQDIEAWRNAWRVQFQVNAFSAVDLTFACLSRLESAQGAVVMVSSRAGLRGEPGFSAYAASKAAMANAVKSLSAELAARRVGVFCVAPGWVRTDMAAGPLAERAAAIEAEIPQGRVAEPEDVANVVSFLLRPESRYLSGITVDVTGGSYLH